MSEVYDVYRGSNGDDTKALYARLAALGPKGVIAMNLFRACKTSERAKQYRGGIRGKGSYRSMAYDRKDYSIGELSRALVQHSDDLGISWGWGRDPKAIGFEDVLYVEIPDCGQVSFHTTGRRDGPDYPGQWDGVRGVAVARIIKFTEILLKVGGEDVSREDRREGGAVAGVSRSQGDGIGTGAPSGEAVQDSLDL